MCLGYHSLASSTVLGCEPAQITETRAEAYGVGVTHVMIGGKDQLTSIKDRPNLLK